MAKEVSLNTENQTIETRGKEAAKLNNQLEKYRYTQPVKQYSTTELTIAIHFIPLKGHTLVQNFLFA